MRPPDYQAVCTAVEATDKRTKTLQAQFALAGYEMHVIGGTSGTAEFRVSRWNMTRVWSSLADAENFGRLVGAVQ